MIPDAPIRRTLSAVDVPGEEPQATVWTFGLPGLLVVSAEGSGDAIAQGMWRPAPEGDGYQAIAVQPRLDEAATPTGLRITQLAIAVADDGSTLTAEGGVDVRTLQGSPILTLDADATGVRVGDDVTALTTRPLVFGASGDAQDQVIPGIAAFLSVTGGRDNGGSPGSLPAGFRAIVWDALPPDQVAPDDYDPAFFNGPAAPVARGIAFATPGEALQVSAAPGDASGAPAGFGHIDPSYTETFRPFSPARVFSPIGSNELEVSFFVPGTDEPAIVRGFGTVFLDVDGPGTSVELLDAAGASLGRHDVRPGPGGWSFAGVTYAAPVIAGARLTLGTAPLGEPEDATADLVVIDDVLYGEPQPIP
jgi:hypothetical protein